MTDSFSQFTVSKADTAILPLVKRFFQSQGMRSQAAKADEIIIIRDTLSNNTIIGALRLCPIHNSWLLRSMCIHQDYQRQGLGRYLLQQIKQNLKEKHCYSFPYVHLESFYTQAGFKKISETESHGEIYQRYKQYSENGKNILLMKFLSN